MKYYLLETIDYTNYVYEYKQSKTNRYCEHGIHSIIIEFIEYEIGIPWDEDIKLLNEELSTIGLHEGYVSAYCGELKILKPFPDVQLYDRLCSFIGNLYDEDFCKINATEITT